MKHFLPITLLFATGCTAVSSSPKEEKQKVELTLSKIRSEIEDIKADLNTYEIEHHILEGKLSDHEQTLASLQQETLEQYASKLDTLVTEMDSVTTDLTSIQEKQKAVLSDISQLSNHANDTSSALGQYKTKLESLERLIETQDGKFEQVAELKKTLQAIVELQNESDARAYTVQAGDTLEKIAMTFQTSVDAIKKANNRTNDLIIVGEVIKVPAASNE